MTADRGHGKVILLGEHAVVHGHPALAVAIGLGVEAHVEPADEDSLAIPAWDPGSPWMRDAAHPLRRAVAAIAQALGVRGHFRITAEATVPPRAGLGSSAALSVAVARALARAARIPADDDMIERAASAGERVFHLNPSGVDVALATRGGIGLYQRETGLVRLATPPFGFRLAVGLSGEPRDTAARVAEVAERLRREPADTTARLAILGALASAGGAALSHGEPQALGALFDQAHEQLGGLGLSSPGLERLRTIARDAQATGAKLTGAGGGGAVIALGPVDDVVAAWQRAGFAAMVVEIKT